MAIHLLSPTEFISITLENVAMNLVSIKVLELISFEFSKKIGKRDREYTYISLNSIYVT